VRESSGPSSRSGYAGKIDAFQFRTFLFVLSLLLSIHRAFKMRTESNRPLTIVEHLLNQSLASSDIQAICSAIRDAAKAYNMSDLSRKSGMDRANIYRSLRGGKDMNFSTILRVLNAMGLDLQIVPRLGEHAAPAKSRITREAEQPQP
jgi:probable addiction module antidote protein